MVFCRLNLAFPRFTFSLTLQLITNFFTECWAVRRNNNFIVFSLTYRYDYLYFSELQPVFSENRLWWLQPALTFLCETPLIFELNAIKNTSFPVKIFEFFQTKLRLLFSPLKFVTIWYTHQRTISNCTPLSSMHFIHYSLRYKGHCGLISKSVFQNIFSIIFKIKMSYVDHNGLLNFFVDQLEQSSHWTLKSDLFF